MEDFEAPIPGQSLTTQPRNAPFERPPELSDPSDALRYHLSRVQNPEVLDSLLTLVEMGVDIKSLTESVMSAAVMEGIHSIDVGLMVAPAVHEFIRVSAKKMGIEYEEGFINKQEVKQREEFKVGQMAKKMALSPEQKETQEELVESVEEEETMEEEMVEPRKGLMERG